MEFRHVIQQATNVRLVAAQLLCHEIIAKSPLKKKFAELQVNLDRFERCCDHPFTDEYISAERTLRVFKQFIESTSARLNKQCTCVLKVHDEPGDSANSYNEKLSEYFDAQLKSLAALIELLLLAGSARKTFLYQKEHDSTFSAARLMAQVPHLFTAK